MNINILERIDTKKWNEFVLNSNGATFFSLYDYYKIQKADIFFVVAFDSHDEIIGGMIGRIRGSSFPTRILFKSIWVESGILIRSGIINDSQNIKMLLLNSLITEAQKRRCIFIKFNHWCRENDPYVYSQTGFEVIPNSTFELDLIQSNEKLFSLQNRSSKGKVRKAKKNGVCINIFDNVDDDTLSNFYQIYSQTQKRAINNNNKSTMTLRSKLFLEQLVANKTIDVYFAGAFINNKLASGAFFVIMGKTIYYFIGGSDIELNKKYGTSNLLIWESILWAKKNGIICFDFGGVPTNPLPSNPAYGVYKFKKNFGGELKTYYSGYKKISILKSNISNFLINNRKIINSMPFVKKQLKNF